MMREAIAATSFTAIKGYAAAATVATVAHAGIIAYELGEANAALSEGAYHGWNSRYDKIEKIGPTEGGYVSGVIIGGLARQGIN